MNRGYDNNPSMPILTDCCLKTSESCKLTYGQISELPSTGELRYPTTTSATLLPCNHKLGLNVHDLHIMNQHTNSGVLAESSGQMNSSHLTQSAASFSIAEKDNVVLLRPEHAGMRQEILKRSSNVRQLY